MGNRKNAQKLSVSVWANGKTLKNCQQEFGQMEKRQAQ